MPTTKKALYVQFDENLHNTRAIYKDSIAQFEENVPTHRDLIFWLRADLLITLNGSDVSSWGDLTKSDRVVKQDTAANQPDYSSSYSVLKDQASVNFSGIDEFLESNGPVSDWRFLHNGTGMTLMMASKSDVTDMAQNIFSTQTAIATSGSQVRWTGAGTPVWSIGDGTVTLVNETIKSNVDDSKFFFTIRYLNGRSGNEFDIRADGASAFSGNDSGDTPPAGDSDGNFKLGIRDNGTLDFQGAIVEVIAYNRYITDAEAIELDNYISNRYGIP